MKIKKKINSKRQENWEGVAERRRISRWHWYILLWLESEYANVWGFRFLLQLRSHHHWAQWDENAWTKLKTEFGFRWMYTKLVRTMTNLLVSFKTRNFWCNVKLKPGSATFWLIKSSFTVSFKFHFVHQNLMYFKI